MQAGGKGKTQIDCIRIQNALMLSGIYFKGLDSRDRKFTLLKKNYKCLDAVRDLKGKTHEM